MAQKSDRTAVPVSMCCCLNRFDSWLFAMPLFGRRNKKQAKEETPAAAPAEAAPAEAAPAAAAPAAEGGDMFS